MLNQKDTLLNKMAKIKKYIDNNDLTPDKLTQAKEAFVGYSKQLKEIESFEAALANDEAQKIILNFIQR